MDSTNRVSETITLLGSELPAKVTFLGYEITTSYIVTFVVVFAVIQTIVVIRKYQKSVSEKKDINKDE